MQTRGPRGLYLWPALALVALTAAAFALVLGAHLPATQVVPWIAAFAVAQVLLQAYFFMHLNASRRLFTLVFGFGLLFATVFAWAIGYLAGRLPG